MKVTFQAVKFWVLEPIMWTLAIIGLYVLLGLGEVRAAPTPTPTQLRVHAASVELAHRLPTGMLAAVCEQESHWRNVSGQRGEIGVCQIMPDTVRMICNCGGVSTAWFQQGSKGPIVKQIQAELTHVGTYYDRIDGIYGPKTAQAVRDLQALLKIKADGVVGPVTWDGLFEGEEPYPGRTITAELWDPYRNIEWAALYLVWLRDTVSNDPALMLAAYNGGPGNPVVRYAVSVQRRMAKAGM